MPGKRILFFNQNFSPHTETFVHGDIAHLAIQNTVKVACIKRMNAKKFPYDNVAVLPYKRSWLMQKLWNRLYAWNISMNYYNAPFYKALNQLIEDFKPDVIHCHFGTVALMLVDNLANLSIPVVVNFLGYDASLRLKSSNIYKKRISFLVKQSNIFTTANANALFHSLKSYGVIPVHHRRIFLGIDTTFFIRKNPPPSSPYTFIQVAGFREKKGHIYLLHAFHQLINQAPHQKFQLILVGNGTLESSLKELCQQLNISNFVHFEGWNSSTRVKELLGKAHCFIHPSITPDNGDKEGIPVAITEAMAMELPIISTYHSGIPELIQDGVHGILVEEKKIQQYVKAMHAIIHWELCPQNREKVCKDFSIQNRGRALENYYEYAINYLSTRST